MRFGLSLLLLGVLASVWLFDLYAGVHQEPAQTVSATLLEWSRRWPMLPFAIGVLIGHLFWPSE